MRPYPEATTAYRWRERFLTLALSAAFNPIGCLCFLTTLAKASSDSPNPLPDSWLRIREVLS
jgi:hypothetical protein